MVVPYARMTLAPALSTLIPFLAASLFHSIFMVLDTLTNTRAALRVSIGMQFNYSTRWIGRRRGRENSDVTLL
jgi:hypothetical protein